MRRILVLAGLLLLPWPVQAQERQVEETDLPRWVENDVIAFFNDPNTIRFTGRSRIPSTRLIGGDVASLGGPFMLAGEIDGDLIIVNGDLIFEEGGVVTGDVWVIGGRVLARELGEIGGNLTTYEDRLRYRQEGDRIARAGPPEDDRPTLFGTDFGYGRSRLTLRVGKNYSRVEGLPLEFGPILESGGDHPFRLEALGIWRTENAFGTEPEDLGYRLRVEQNLDALPGRFHLSIGGTLHSEIVPMEDWTLSDLEASLATFLFHKDYRDYFEREGWSGYARLRLPFVPVTIQADYTEEDHGFVPVGGPWSLKDNDEPWRAQPLVAEGRLRSVGGSIVVDSRNDRDDPTQGIYLSAKGRWGLGGSLTVPGHYSEYLGPQSGPDVAARDVKTEFVTGFLDVRSYNRVGPRTELRLRGVLGGSLNGEPVPSQFQHALGGEGSLPGYGLFTGDCGARSQPGAYTYPEDGETIYEMVYPSYGCDRIALFQAEWRGGSIISFDTGRRRSRDDWDWYPTIELDPAWTVFFNAGRGWSLGDAGTGFAGQDTQTLMDLGFGIFLGDLGLYWAYPLNQEEGEDRVLNFFVRLSHRF